MSGPGLATLALHMTGKTLTAPDVLATEPRLKAAWLGLAARMVALIARSNDPDVIVLGGGLGMTTGLPAQISAMLAPLLLRNTKAPRLVQARHGDASGALGAALYAQSRGVS